MQAGQTRESCAGQGLGITESCRDSLSWPGALCVAQGEKQTLGSYLLFPAKLDGSSPGLGECPFGWENHLPALSGSDSS